MYKYVRVRACVTSSDNTMERHCGRYSVMNCQCDVTAFYLRRSMCRLSKIDVSSFTDRCVDFKKKMIDLSTFEDRCGDLRGSMVDVSVDLR